MTIFLSTESRTLAELLVWDSTNPAKAPFIKIGRLLLAVDKTGCEAWQPLMKQLKQQHNATKFSLYSGRHGALEGCFQDNGEVPASAHDRCFYDDDVKEAARYGPAEGVDIEVVDTARTPMRLYTQRVLTDIACGQWVIVVWCHSIASMTRIPNNAPEIYHKGPLFISAQNTSRRRVCDIVREDYGWVR